ncbi:MAG: CoB--CoM heterodisulfide reductase iron-sulfur subunit A family protein [Nitrososphaerota archaeon]|nr:CoB--CoM heterodisulfide reductase iron-sulfur subunit A family protein [Candidatus Bathyarchaeota archaeon]MDW8022207.1 CoB--CoM heterodisulfide reductase iron-sulfur subunit A family protein [Nitrososphaerota archaeon]
MQSENGEASRIGVYVCHCGTNIAGTVDVKKVTEHASRLPKVVIARNHTYLCSDAGQRLIKQDVRELKLDRVVVAACSPTLHQQTFSKCVEDVGLNGYLVAMANIREQCSWVHASQPKEATEKAIDLVKMSVARASLLKPLTPKKVPVRKSCLVLGGGIAGIQAALDLADEGFDVYLVEKKPSIGGHMAQLDKTFPTLDCSLCILAPKMALVAHNPKIHLFTNSEVTEVSGYIGNFKVKIKVKPRYVKQELCNGCGECVKVCPIEVPNEFDEKLGPRKAIYIPFPQAVPLIYTIDMDNCIECYKCVEACSLRAIDFSQKPMEIELEVGTIIVATGFEVFDPSVIEEYGYKIYENVVTGIEFERILSPTGPTGGRIIRQSDGKVPKRIAFIQCVGSRDEKTKPYCSRVCCMYAIKQALLIREKIREAEIVIFYVDIRAFGKGYEEFYKRAQMEGIYFIRGRVAEIIENPEAKNLIVRAEDTLTGKPIEAEFEMVVLSVGLAPNNDTDLLRRTLNITISEDGFLREAHPKLRPVDSLIDGIFIAGAAQGPKDIPDSVAQASASAQKASILMTAGETTIEPFIAKVEEELCSGCGICESVCAYGAVKIEKNDKGNLIAYPIEVLCKGCGVCAAACPTKAVQVQNFTDEQILAEIKAAIA